jgi:hypothetical protein
VIKNNQAQFRLIKCGISYQVIPRTHLEEGDTPLRHIIASVATLLNLKDDFDYSIFYNNKHISVARKDQ